MPNIPSFDSILFHPLYQRKRGVAPGSSGARTERRRTTSPSFQPLWTKPSRATAPSSSPRPPLHLPSRTPDNGAPEREIKPLLPRRPPPLPWPTPPLPVSHWSIACSSSNLGWCFTCCMK
ncbi:Os11g0698567 [Oryza sativa Japonica Group]|uniref:Os11g0697350 protein n=2 Tax=Oryza sativa subsp. japonica TaxID=39947 RepID=C7J8L9_ORYSJ|nr:hypothetical protein EE612_057139 [Oryza sativa]BAH95461.1 Os11g0697400 [Oryza sativa Japonica Group]BAT15356.1 Os11g0697350 [Oryza sativa Japonica Group]BAT15358.1 Os11g0698567 [Oryza sativa Japonica Group]|eukprot:NP_001176733.1 Os11g0697400 [Oryza sativa Japonica Group]